MPQDSSADSWFITQLMQDGVLFPLVTGQERSSLQDRLLESPGRLLTLFSLAQDTLFLEPCAKVLQQLVPPRVDDLKSALLKGFRGGGNTWPIQFSENAIHKIDIDYAGSPASYQAQQMTTAYLQLWLFVMRYIEAFGYMKLAAPYAESDAAPLVYKPTKEEAKRRLAVLAQYLGFDSKRIRSALSGNTTLSSTREFLGTTRPKELYEYPTDWEHNASDMILQVLSIPGARSEDGASLPSLPVSGKESTRTTRKRCGLPVGRFYAEDCCFLYIPHLMVTSRAVSNYPTPFAIVRDIIISFWGREHFPQGFSPPWQRSPPDGLLPSSQPVVSFTSERAPSETLSLPESIELDPHPPGTPPIPADQDQISTNASRMTTTEAYNLEMVLDVPMAAGFEDETHIAPLNQTAYITHNRSAKEITKLWNNSGTAELSVYYIFKKRAYRKFRLGDPGLFSAVSSFVYEVANDHFFYIIENDEVVMLNASQAIEVAQTGKRLIFVSTRFEHQEEPPMVHYWDYICSFDSKTGKRAANSTAVIRKQQKSISHSDPDVEIEY